ncbi:Peptidyl-prolyl cis-trans isomerase Mip [bioreactor metagenome]|uniref:peptidylprolyl isomerase n=1 Tax=bioreactor metagenome TaxID=1076179 RepID=A0A644XEF8_9ZZZZ
MAPAEKTVEIRDAISDLLKPLSLDDRFSYTYGYMLFTTLQQQGFDNLSSSYFAKGALDAGKSTGFFSQEEMTQILHQVQTNLLQKAQQERAKIAAENLQAAEDFLSSNGKQDGIVTTESGLQYRILVQGSGEKPSAESIVEVDYQIILLNGRVIDSSYERKQSSSFQLQAIMVPGFIEGVKLMQTGSKYRFWIHPNLAYGVEGTQAVDPNSLLIVEVELKAIK